MFVVVLLPCKNDFVVRYRPQERFCGVLSPTRTIFVRGNHALQGLLTLGQLTLIFTNSHVILPSFGCVCCVCDFRYEERQKEVHERVQKGDWVEPESIKLTPLIHSHTELCPP